MVRGTPKVARWIALLLSPIVLFFALYAALAELEEVVVLYADEALDPASVEAGLYVSENGVRVSGEISMEAGAGTIEFFPDAPFAPA